MNWDNQSATEQRPGNGIRPEDQGHSPGQPELHEIRIDKSISHTVSTSTGAGAEVFKMTLGGETIELLPLKNWAQLDHYKWTVRGKLPAEPAGLEVAVDHVKIAGETVTLSDIAGCEKLEKLFNEWLRTERASQVLTSKKPAYDWAKNTPPSDQQSQGVRFQVEVDKLGQVHVHCRQGKETLASIGLTAAGFNSLTQQGLMRKPRTLKTGVLHDWVELDGELCSFEKGKNESARLQQLLNDQYVPTASAGGEKQVVMYLNPASPTGFDIQFPVKVGGVATNQRQHWDDHALELLQDADHCGLLHKEIIVKLIPPNLVFKRKTRDGGEQYLSRGPEHTVTVVDEDGSSKSFDLSAPLMFLRLSPAELSAIFNHPAINRHTQSTPAGKAQPAAPNPAAGPPKVAIPPAAPERQPAAAVSPAAIAAEIVPSGAPGTGAPPARSESPAAQAVLSNKPVQQAPPRVRGPINLVPGGEQEKEAPRPLPNLWLRDILHQPGLPGEWFTRLVYTKMALHFGNSNEGQFGPHACWFISLGECAEVEDPAFKGIFLTEKGGLGFLNQRQIARFSHGVAFVGPQDAPLEGVHVKLQAVGLDAQARLIFVVNDDYRAGFDDPEITVGETLQRLGENGAVVMSAADVLASSDPIEVIWTVPKEQSNPAEPEAVENLRSID